MKKMKLPKVNMKKIKKKWILGSVVVLLIVIAGSRFFVMRSRMNQITKRNTAVNATVTTGTIQNGVSGTGIISYADTTDIVVPSNLTIEELLVSEGSNVTAGELIATVEEASLALCLSEVEEAIADVDSTISSESSSSTSQTIKAGVAGRVKKIYADADDSVVDIMKEQGALMLLSADDLMMVTLEDVKSLTVGEEVVVSNGDVKTDGTVENVGSSGTVITFDDSVFTYEEELTIMDENDAILGKAKAYIHQPIKVVASSGIISSLNVSLNSNVSASTSVFTLTDGAKSAEYMQAVTEREQLVSLLNTLVAIQVNGGITAPVDGMLQTVNTSTDDTVGSANQTSGGYMMGATNEVQSEKSVQVAENTVSAKESVAMDTVNKGQIVNTVASSVNIRATDEQNVLDATKEMTQLATTNVVTDIRNVTTTNDTKLPAEVPFGLTGGAGVIYGTTVAMEYADKEDATEWKACTDEKTEVAAGIWYVRMKETDTLAASAAVKVEVTVDETEVSTKPGSQDSTKENATQESENKDKENEPTLPSENSNGESDKGNVGDNNADEDEKSGNKKEKTGDFTGGNVPSGGSSGRGNSSVSVSSSSTATATTSSVETTNMFTISNGDKMVVTMNVDELDIGLMEVGQEAEITLDAIEGQTFTGIITNVSGNASSSGGSSQYPVEIIFDKAEAMLSGMNASVEVITTQAENVLVVPLSAVQDEGNYSYVYTEYDEESGILSGKVQVETGLSDETNVEIVTGLSEGNTVYYEMQGSEDGSADNTGMGNFTMPGGMNMPGGMSMPSGDFPGGDMPSGGFDGNRQNSSNRGMGGR